MSNYDNMKALIERISGQPSVISIMRLYVDIFGDLETAAVVSQCVFWSDKGTIEEGWFYKSRDDWKKAIGIKRTALDSAIKHANTLSTESTWTASPTSSLSTSKTDLLKSANRTLVLLKSTNRKSHPDLLKPTNPIC